MKKDSAKSLARLAFNIHGIKMPWRHFVRRRDINDSADSSNNKALDAPKSSLNLKFNQAISVVPPNGMALAIERANPLIWMRKVRHYQLTPQLALTIKSCRPAFKWFMGKTNRLALVSLSLCGVELDLYIARHWDYPAWEEASEELEDTEAPDHRTQH